MNQYLELLQKIKDEGRLTGDRTGTGTRSFFGHQMRFDLQKGLPVVTTKKIHIPSIMHELIWMLSGDTNDNYLRANNVKIWEEWTASSSKYPDDKRIPVWVNKKVISDVSSNHLENPIDSDFNIDENTTEQEHSLHHVWWRMIDRCYNKNSHNYKFYGGSGITVDTSWHSCKKFINDAKLLKNWEDKLNDWSNYNLDKDYFSSNVYSKETCVWLNSKENNVYTKKFRPFEIEFEDGRKKIYLSLFDCSSSIGIPRTTIYRYLEEGLPKNYKTKNSSSIKRLRYIEERDEKSLRLRFSSGDLGPVYGAQWRNWNSDGIDQIQIAIDDLKNKSESRRITVNSWNPSVLPDTSKSFDFNVANGKAALPPCHSFFQLKSYEATLEERITWVKQHYPLIDLDEAGPSEMEGFLDFNNVPRKIVSLQLYQRSADVFLGVPFNITFYATLTEMFAAQTGMIAKEFIHTFGDVHIYNNHVDQVDLQLSREPYKLPQLILNPNIKSIFDYSFEDIKVANYQHHSGIKGKVSI